MPFLSSAKYLIYALLSIYICHFSAAQMSKLVIVYCEDIVIRYPSSATQNTTIIPFVDSTK
jgi:hypothetical protein